METYISIIIPMYNAELHIKQCINALNNQTNKNFELIIVDDGSTDNSLKILIDYIKDRKHTYIFSQKNSGVSAARNFGISKAHCKYVTFVDCDDIIDNRFVENLHNIIINNDYDYIMSGTSFLQNKGIIKTIKIPDDSWHIEKLSTKFRYLDYTTSIHGKLYKKEILDKYNIRYNINMSYAEDRDFNIEYLNHIKTIRTISYIGYYYNTDVINSLSKKKHSNILRNNCIYWNKVLNLSNEHSFLIYVANNMFYGITDNISEMVKTIGWYKTVKELHVNAKYMNYKFIKSYQHYITAPFWVKKVFCISPILYSAIQKLLSSSKRV